MNQSRDIHHSGFGKLLFTHHRIGHGNFALKVVAGSDPHAVDVGVDTAVIARR